MPQAPHGLAAGIRFVVSCEHGGNRIPPAYADAFAGCAPMLASHQGYDAGALQMARDLAAALDAPLFAATVSRLLIDANRSRGRRGLYSAVSRRLPAAQRRAIFADYYVPYRRQVEDCIAGLVAAGHRVIHFSSHSFTPELDGDVRCADVGLLYDPSRAGEIALCRAWQQALGAAADLRVRRNYPYAGVSDGFTAALRRRFGGDRYLGIEIEINQKHVRADARHWRSLRRFLIEALRRAFGTGGEAAGET